MILRLLHAILLMLLVVAVVVFTGYGMFGWLLWGLLATIVLVYQACKRRERQAMLAWHLALATSRGRALPAELRAFARDLPTKWRARTLDVAEDLEEGLPLSRSLGMQGRLLPSWALTSIRVGEESGRLPEALRDAALRMTRQPEHRLPGSGPLAMTLVYLCILLALCTSVLSFLTIQIVPKFRRIFEGFDTGLPAITSLLVDLTDWFANYWYIAAPVLLLPFAALVLVAYAYKRGWGEIDVPIAPAWQARFDTPNLARDLAAAIEAALPLGTALAALSETHRRGYVRLRLRRAAETVDNGGDPWEALARENFLAEAEVTLLRSAERVGNLPWVLRTLADARERRGAYRLFAIAQFVEPLAVLGLGLLVLFVCVAFFLPLVKLLNDLS